MAYVYRHIRLDKNEPFYIGIGSDNDGKYARAKSKDERNNHWHNIVACTDYKVQIMFDDLTWEEACQKEIELIALYGRRDLNKGTLCNLTNGGEGNLNPSEDVRYRIGSANRGKKIEKSIIEKSVNTRKENYKKGLHKKQDLSGGNNGMFGKSHTEESKLKMSLNSKNPSLETRKKMSDSRIGKVGSQNGRSKKVINVINGIIYDSTSIAYKELNIEMNDRHFRDILKNKKGGVTDFMYLEEYKNLIKNC